MKTAHLSPCKKYHAYEVLHDLNRGFQITHSSLDSLDRLNLVPRDNLRPCHHMAEELRSLTNSAVLSIFRDAESREAAHYEKLRLQWQHRNR
jgi:hypothetical protein